MMLLAEPIEYGTRASPRPGRPAVLSIVGVASVISAVLGIAFAIWYATQTYYTILLKPPPAPTSRYVRPAEPVARRVTVEEGDAIIDGIALVVPITQPQRDIMKRMLVNADHAGVAVVTGPAPTAATIAANASESGKLFGEEGYYAVIGQVRVELTNERGLLGHARKRTPRISYSGSSSSYEHDRPDVLSFEPPPPPPANPPPAPVTSGPLTLAQTSPLIVRYAAALAGAGMAVLLLCAGISLLRLTRSGRLLHLLWGWLKLPLALGAAAAYFFVVLDGQLALSRGITPWTNAVLAHPALFAPLRGAAYAVVVLIVMYLPGVRGYFRQSPARSE